VLDAWAMCVPKKLAVEMSQRPDLQP
jgi:hypothetical protein